MFSSRLPDSISFPIPLRSEAHSDAPMRAPSLHSSNPNHGSPFQNGPSYPTAQVSTDATTASKDLRRPAKHLLHSDTDEDSAPAKRIRSLDTQENDAEATANIKDTNTQQSHHGQPQQQQRAPKKKKWPPSSKQQINLMHRLKYNNTARMGKRAVVVFTENANMQSRKKVNDPHIYSYGLRVLGLPAELKAMIFSYLDFRTLGKACMGKNTKAGKMQGKIVVSSAELREVVWEGALEAFFARNEIPYSPAMAAALGVDNRYDYVLILFRFMLEKGCHGCGAGVYIGCHYWVFGKNFCGDCLKANLVDVRTTVRLPTCLTNSATSTKKRSKCLRNASRLLTQPIQSRFEACLTSYWRAHLTPSGLAASAIDEAHKSTRSRIDSSSESTSSLESTNSAIACASNVAKK